ncbi:hypothetical protein CXB51_004864 [Gossypium anomalum]|uniref:RNase H type-1 domain-containing protein n=1 Tax=Gossypium anomalum TaxID=47600 RepID=A0A8J5ZBB9_9ROSI|nr:hypothetical protein CXB51_004864 [Gossypium anomalum]
MDAERILCIPLSMYPHKDLLVWSSESTGEYTIRSGHRLIACTLWALWTSRNRFIHEGGFTSGSQIADYVRNFLKELDGLNMDLHARQIFTGRWVAPIGSRIKINFDTAFNKQRKESCSGMVALHLGLFFQLREVKIEGDSYSVIYKLQEQNEDRSEIAAIIKDSKQLSLGFDSCDFSFIHRESNQVAHFIAIEGLKKRKNSYLVSMAFSGEEDAVPANRRGLKSRGE